MQATRLPSQSDLRKREERATACSPAGQIQRNSNSSAARYRGVRFGSRCVRAARKFPTHIRASRSTAARSDLPRGILPPWREYLCSRELSPPVFSSPARSASGSRSFPKWIQSKPKAHRARNDSTGRTTLRAREELPAIELLSAQGMFTYIAELAIRVAAEKLASSPCIPNQPNQSGGRTRGC